MEVAPVLQTVQCPDSSRNDETQKVLNLSTTMKPFISHLPERTVTVFLSAALASVHLISTVRAAAPVAVLPVLETPQTLDTGETVPAGVLQGDSDDPAIWVHPTNPEHSLVIATLKNGGLAVFDLGGQLRQLFAPAEYGALQQR